MKSLQKSIVSKFRLSRLIPLIWLLGCSSAETTLDHTDQPPSDEISLKGDRHHLDELRKEIPEERKQENDELAGILRFTGELKDHPSKIRTRFNKAIRRVRKKFNNKMRRDRTLYDRKEREQRRIFLDEKKKNRTQFVKEHHDHKESREFYRQQETRSRELFSDQRAKRRDFESDMRQKRNERNAYYQERSNEFNQEHRIYTKKYYEWKNAKKLKKNMEKKARRLERKRRTSPLPSVNPYQKELEEFKKIPTSPGVPLTPDDE